jgi:branched-chain amino acid transport system permease protein
MAVFLQLLFSGLMTGGVYALVALGFVVVWKSTSVFNFAQGEILMVSAYICWALLVQVGLPLWATFIVTFVVAACLGLTVERFALRPMIGQPLLAAMMITLALIAVLDGLVTIIWGSRQEVLPDFFPRAPLHLGSVMISQQLLVAFIIAIGLFFAFVLFFRRSKFGLAMRATAEDHQVTRSMGIKVSNSFAMAWVVACIVAAVGGILLGSVNGVNMNLGFLGLKAFPVVILGGLDSIPGAIIAGLIVGILEKLATGYIDPFVGGGFAEIFPFIILLFVLLVRPYGLFGQERIERI